MKKFFWAIWISLILPAHLVAQDDQFVSSQSQNDTVVLASIVPLFEAALKSQPFIDQMKGDTIVTDSLLPFFWEVSIKKSLFVFGKGGNLLAVDKTAWYSVTLPGVTFLWDARQSEGTVYTFKTNFQIEKVKKQWRIVAAFQKK